MGERELNEIQNMNDEDLIRLYHSIEEHMNYLDEHIIHVSEEGGDVSNESL